MRWRLTLVGDIMLGRSVAEWLQREPTATLVDDQIIEALRSADITLGNLECCISDRGRRWPDPRKPFFFRAPPVAAERLAQWGIDVVTLANNHALDYGVDALVDTLRHLAGAGVLVLGAGADIAAARRPLHVAVADVSVGIVAFSDHPDGYAATRYRPGIAYADLRSSDIAWVYNAVRTLRTDVTVVTPHWGPNMTRAPCPAIRTTAANLVEAGATLIAGHSAHVFHGVGMVSGRPILYDLGDFLDDYVVDPELRNDLGLVWTVVFDGAAPIRIEALPVKLEYCATRCAPSAEARHIASSLRRACAALGTEVEQDGGRLVLYPDQRDLGVD